MEYGFEEMRTRVAAGVRRAGGLGLCGVAVPEGCGGAGGSMKDSLRWSTKGGQGVAVPRPVRPPAVARWFSDPKLRSARRQVNDSPGWLDGGDPKTSTASAGAGGAPGGVVLLPADGNWLLVDTACDEGRSAARSPATFAAAGGWI